jgi:small subunit ribosomal protein S16
MVRIRLRRVGRKGQPSYRIVVADARSPRDGRYIEIIGFYNPRTQPDTMTIKEDRALYWLSVGAQPSEAVQRILDKLGTTARFERLRKGEALETLVAEAEAEAEARPPVSPKTQYPAKSKSAKAAAKAAKAEAEAESGEMPEAV